MTPASLLNAPIQMYGHVAATRPIVSAVRPASRTAVQATLKARPLCPAPIFVSIIIPAGPPIPYDNGTRRNSRRAPAPYPARASTPAEPTKPVMIAIVRLVVELTIADKPPTRRISRIGPHSKRGGT